MKKPVLELRDLKVIYKTDMDTVHAVNSVNLCLGAGSTLGVVGETGAGKTTVALSIMRLLPERTGKIVGGEISFFGQDLIKFSDADMRLIRGERIAMIFQDPMTSLNPVFTVGEQIAEAIRLHNASKRTESEIENRVDEVLSLVGISSNRKTEYPHQFSGGMRQRVVIAIALACEPDLLIADEPTTALDVTIQAQVLMMIRELRDRLNMSMMLITHDLGIVAQTCDNVAVMYAGEMVEVGTAVDIFKGNTHHPYIIGLFGSIPSFHNRSKRLTPIPGLMPDLVDLPSGCCFAPRCPNRMSQCDAVHPNIYVCGTQKISCHLFADKKEWAKEE
ncbi:MAG: ABC transporter ATP-binding protein [Synergistaceae bacterium]|nr:ABC transporter ATP-binding protein [Synergistaceae bacterium]